VFPDDGVIVLLTDGVIVLTTGFCATGVALHLKVRFWADRLVIAVKSETEVGYCTES
jgi:hypothetical protein